MGGGAMTYHSLKSLSLPIQINYSLVMVPVNGKRLPSDPRVLSVLGGFPSC